MFLGNGGICDNVCIVGEVVFCSGRYSDVMFVVEAISVLIRGYKQAALVDFINT